MTRHLDNKRGDEAGFTLLELLISMTLLGLLMVVVLGGLRFGARAWERNEAHTTATDDIRQTQALLRREIGLAYPLLVLDQANLTNRHVDFDGSEDSMSFLAPAPSCAGRGGPCEDHAYARCARRQNGTRAFSRARACRRQPALQ